MDTDVDVYEDLTGQVALVTGATRGIGATTAAGLAERGATVYAGARDTDDISSDEQCPLELDVTDDAEIETALSRIDEAAGRLDVLVNNAGVGGSNEPLDETSMDDIDRTLATNLRGPVAVTKTALPLLLAREGGRVVNVSSGMGALTGGMSGGSPAYRISKAGVNGLTTYLDGEYGSRGLIANSASPGWVRTDMGGSNADRSVAEGADTPLWLARFEPGSPSGRFWRNREPTDW
jgi:NAD(P)-dependent dehydrogenase (short-subunit alcohol dehydrogenase family)